MSEIGMASLELQAKTNEIADHHFQAERTDTIAADQKKRGHTSEYTCRKCGSNNVNMTTMQTRSSDEPMTEFYKCLNCGHGWRICP